MDNSYAKAYTEVLEILKYLPTEEYNKVPKKQIEFYQNNCDKQYKFEINPNVALAKQNISRKANAVLVFLFKEYFTTDKQKETLNNILEKNLYKEEQTKKAKYSTENIFNKETNNQENVAIVPYKESILTKILNKIKSIFKK